MKPYQEANVLHNDQEASRDDDAAEVVADRIRLVTIPNNVLSVQEEQKAEES